MAGQEPFFKVLASKLGAGALGNIPIYDQAAFTRQLGDSQWRWYSHDPATLRAADGTYRDPTDFKTDNFSYFDRKAISADQLIRRVTERYRVEDVSIEEPELESIIRRIYVEGYTDPDAHALPDPVPA